MARRGNNGGGIFIGSLIGGVIGAVGALMLAPKPGNEMRKDIMNSIQNNNQGGNNNFPHTLYEMGSEWLDNLNGNQQQNNNSNNSNASNSKDEEGYQNEDARQSDESSQKMNEYSK